MPYTALQTLGWLARCSKWERAFNVNRTFLRYSPAHQQRRCRLTLGKKKRGARKGCRKGLIVVFKVTAQEQASEVKKARKRGGRNEGVKDSRNTGRLSDGHQGCGMLDCRVCEALFGIFCEGVEAMCKQDRGDDVESGSPLRMDLEEEEHAGSAVADGCAVFNAKDCQTKA